MILFPCKDCFGGVMFNMTISDIKMESPVSDKEKKGVIGEEIIVSI